MDQVYKNNEKRDGKDQADRLRWMVQDMKDNQTESFDPEATSTSSSIDGEHQLAAAHDPANAHVDQVDDQTDQMAADQAVESPQQHEEKAEVGMEQDSKAMEVEAVLDQDSDLAGAEATADQDLVPEDAGRTSDERADLVFDESGSSSEADESDEEWIDEAYLNQKIEELCMSKAEEFAMLGYEGVTGKDIWDFVSEKYEQKGFPPLHRLINDILSLRPTHYMNWLTLSAYKGNNFLE